MLGLGILEQAADYRIEFLVVGVIFGQMLEVFELQSELDYWSIDGGVVFENWRRTRRRLCSECSRRIGMRDEGKADCSFGCGIMRELDAFSSAAADAGGKRPVEGIGHGHRNGGGLGLSPAPIWRGEINI